jgi:phenylacetate-CoA ligase
MLNVDDYTFGMPEIERHIHRNLKIPETPANQMRLFRKWQVNASSLHAATSEDPELRERKQLGRVSALVDFAYSSHPFYQKLYKDAGFKRGDIVTWDDYNVLPTVSKQDIIENSEVFRTAYSMPSVDECYTSMTSGSSGQVLTAIFDSAMIDEDMMMCLRFYEQILGRPRQEREWLYQVYVASPPFTSLDGRFPTFTVSNECSPEAVLEHINRLKPVILSGLPSYLDRLGDLISDPASLGIRGINTNSESSTEAQREKISRQFNAAVYDEYSSVELGLIATQCRERKYHIVEDNVRVDVLNHDEDGMGEIVATSLINSYMPFIRYRQGDMIEITDAYDSECGCGNKFRHLKSFMGRRDQFLVSKTIGKVSPDRIMAIYDRIILTQASNVAEFQIVQKDIDDVQLIFVARDKKQAIPLDVIKRFCDELKVAFNDPNLKITPNQVETMPSEKSYKRRLIKCEYKP